VSLKKVIEQELGIPVRVRMGAPGSLDVYYRGEQIYSKKQTGRLPRAEELIELVRRKSGRA
jgi:predicted Rdx family selenoprotein